VPVAVAPSEAGEVLGYASSYSHGSSSGTFYEGADREWLGRTNKDTETGWESSTAISKSADGSYLESETDTQYAKYHSHSIVITAINKQ
jgi:hypothetical protein